MFAHTFLVSRHPRSSIKNVKPGSIGDPGFGGRPLFLSSPAPTGDPGFLFFSPICHSRFSFCHPRSSIKNVKDKPRSGIQPSVIPDSDRGSSVVDLSFARGSFVQAKDTGFRIKSGMTERGIGDPGFLLLSCGVLSCGVSAPHDEVPSQGPFTSLPSASLRTSRTSRTSSGQAFCFGKRTQNQWRPGVALRKTKCCHSERSEESAFCKRSVAD